MGLKQNTTQSWVSEKEVDTEIWEKFLGDEYEQNILHEILKEWIAYFLIKYLIYTEIFKLLKCKFTRWEHAFNTESI